MQIVYKLDLIIQIKPTHWIYFLQIQHGRKSAFQFEFILLKCQKMTNFLSFLK